REIVEIATLEQQRIGQDLHDDCGQELTALGLLADGLVESLKESASEDGEVATKIDQGLKRVLRRIRNIARGQVLAEVEAECLPAALAELTSRLSETSGIRFVFENEQNVHISDSIRATHLFHIAQEACTNALKHARATSVEVRLQYGENALILRIQDDGIGIPEDAREGLGRRIMRHRASAMGARLSIEPAKPQGTVIICTLSQEYAVVSDKKQENGGEGADRR